MTRWFVSFTVVMIAACMLLGGCAQAAPATSPTSTPVQPPKAAEPTKASAPQVATTQAAIPAPSPAGKATSAPAAAATKPGNYPEKGKTITVIQPWAAGSANDLGSRILFSIVEKQLGIPTQVINRVGASGQVGITELAKSKPDGYTIGYTNFPASIYNYLDPDRQATYTRKDLQPLAMQVMDPQAVSVRADSPYKTLKDLIDAAKANPEKIKMADTGIGGDDQMAVIQLEQLTGTVFAQVHFDGASQSLTGLLGGHVDAVAHNVGDYIPQFKSGEIRTLGVMDKEESKFLPGVKTFEAQGIKLYSDLVGRNMSLPAGTPRPIVDYLADQIKKAMDSDEHMSKLNEMGVTVRYMGPAELESYWIQAENLLKSLMPTIKKQR